ncbi:hypothetical protein GRO01_01600 [Gluconobacter roseus NBRC 3990]|uniref:Uncharacterized protein n=1 Tax=Gluconobacter roseus NBRC 3990 TaxID=1307950 RepID=A0A4Y3M234_9PROT|nr:hypothetical protein GRO01_01600 [Gluconobacter roseus NBRC 3990]GLP93044.1 hypothetical protein GCM10007871_10220 [Gluconobacter roseus NBRC 3990]
MLAGAQHPVVVADEFGAGIAADFLEATVDRKNTATGISDGNNGGTVEGVKNEIVTGPLRPVIDVIQVFPDIILLFFHHPG